MPEIRYRALLVGNSTFPDDPHNLPELKGPPHDLRQLEEVLTHKQVGLHDPADVKAILDCTREEVMKSMEDFFGAARGDEQQLFYYSGHGRLDKFNNLYFCTRDTVTANLLSTSIPATMLSTIIDNSASRRSLIILDCCHSGRFRGADLPANLVGEGRFVLTSCRARELAEDTAEGDGPSPFTKHIVEAILSGDVDADKNGLVSANEIYDYVAPRLRDATKQIPQRRLDEAVGDLTVARSIGRPQRRRGKPSGRPILAVSETRIEITDVRAGELLPEETIDVMNEGGGTLDWTVQCDDDWIEVATHKSYFTFKMTPRPGPNRGRIYVRDRGQGGSKRIQVYVKVDEEEKRPVLELSAERIDFGTVNLKADVPRETIRLINSGGGVLEAKLATYGGKWFEVDLKKDILEVTPVTTGAGEHAAEVVITSNGGDATIPLRVNVERGPVLSVKPKQVDFGKVEEGQASWRKVEITDTGSGGLKWQYQKNGDFFGIERKGDRLVLELETPHAGKHHGSIFITSNGGEATVAIRAKVVPAEMRHSGPTPIPPAASLAGSWALPNAQGILVFTGAGAHYQYVEMNMLGIQLGQGAAQVQGNVVTFQGMNIAAGPVAGQFTIQGNMMIGQITAAGITMQATLMRM